MKRSSKIGISTIITGLALTSSAFAADLKVGGFVNGQYSYNFSNTATNGFTVPEAALTLSKDSDNSNAMLILPFAITQGGTTGSGFGFVSSVTQAFVGHKYSNGFSWKLGQFEKIFGNETIYSSLTHFTSISPMINSFYGFTHTGVLMGYATKGFDLKVLVADNSAATNNAGLWSGNGPDLGLRADISDMFYVGGRYRFQASGAANTDYLINAGLKMDSKPLMLGLDFAFASTAANSSQWGITGLGVYAMNDEVDLGARLGYRSTGTNTFDLAIGPEFKMNKDLRVKIDYDLSSTSATTTHAAAVSGVYML